MSETENTSNIEETEVTPEPEEVKFPDEGSEHTDLDGETTVVVYDKEKDEDGNEVVVGWHKETKE